MGFVQQLQLFLKGMFQWWIVIAPWEQGIRIRLGKNTKLLEPGIHLKLPVIDVAYSQPIRIRAQHIRPQTLTTKDGKAVSLSAAIQYKIDDLLLLYHSVHSPQDVIEARTQGAIAEYVSQHAMDEIKPSEIERDINRILSIADIGLEFKDTKITCFAVVRTYRLIGGELGSWSDYNSRMETSNQAGEPLPN